MPLSTQAPFFSERGMISFSIFYFQFLIFESAVALRRIANRKSQIKNRQSLDSPISHDHFLRPFVPARLVAPRRLAPGRQDRKSTRLNSSHTVISYAVLCLKKKTTTPNAPAKGAHVVV